ncbi:MAG: SDR family NAD(P)-dependent oxidoreductase [Fidelibacterota bacterium]
MNKFAIITGASSGIGFELAHICAREGFDLLLTARRENLLSSLQEDIEKKYGVSVDVFPLDFSLKDSPLKVFEFASKRGRNIDVLINNAGFGQFGYFKDTQWEIEDQMIRLNISALVHLTKLVLPKMLDQRSGRIMNVSSTAAFQPGPLMSVYYATKAFVESFTEAISEECSGTGVTITSLCPGPTISGFQEAAGIEHIRLFKGRGIPSSKLVAEYGFKAMMTGKRVAIYGWMNRVMTFSVRFTPRRLLTKVVKWLQSERT